MIDIQLILRAKMERKEIQNFKQQIQIITCNDHNPSQFNDGKETEQGEKRNKNGGREYISSTLYKLA